MNSTFLILPSFRASFRYSQEAKGSARSDAPQRAAETATRAVQAATLRSLRCRNVNRWEGRIWPRADSLFGGERERHPVRIRGHSISTQSRPRCSRASRPEMRSALSRSGKALGLVSQGPVIAIKRPRSWPALNGALDPSRKRRTGHKTEDILYYSPRARPSLQSVVRLWSCCALSSSKTISAPLTMKSRKSKQALC